jgi:hypothetical protein
MRKILPFLVSGFAVLLVGVVAYECKAQTDLGKSAEEELRAAEGVRR